MSKKALALEDAIDIPSKRHLEKEKIRDADHDRWTKRIEIERQKTKDEELRDGDGAATDSL